MRGSILQSEAYALGKMLDHSSWGRGEWVLPRGITPSDIDAVFDNNGSILFVELSSEATDWSALSKGQRMAYESAIRGTSHCAVLCKHGMTVHHEVPIDTRYAISGFQPMVHDGGKFIVAPFVRGNEHWETFVRRWFDDAPATRESIIQKFREAA